MRDPFYYKKEGIVYYVYKRGVAGAGDIKLISLSALTEEEAELNRLAAPIYLEAQALAAKIMQLSPEVAKIASGMIQDVGVACWQKMKQDPLLEQDEIQEHMINGVLHRPVKYWSYS